MSTVPLACALSSPELQQRKTGLLASVRLRAARATAQPNGLELSFVHEEALLADLLELIRLEAQCCPFLRFELRVGPRPEPHRLVVTGPAGTAAFLEGLGWHPDPASSADKN